MDNDSKVNKILSEKFESEKFEFQKEELWAEINDTINSYKSSTRKKAIKILLLSLLPVLLILCFYIVNIKISPESLSTNESSTGIDQPVRDEVSRTDLVKEGLNINNTIVRSDKEPELSQDLNNDPIHIPSSINNREQSILNDKKQLSINSQKKIAIDGNDQIAEDSKNQAVLNADPQKQKINESNLVSPDAGLISNSFSSEDKFSSENINYNQAEMSVPILQDISDKLKNQETNEEMIIASMSLLPGIELQEIPYDRNENFAMAYSRRKDRSNGRSQIGFSLSSFLSDVNYNTSLTGDSPTYDALQSTTARAGYGVSAFYRKTFSNNFILSGGAEYLKIRERFVGSADLGSGTSMMTVDTAFYRNKVEGREYFPGDVLVDCDSLHYVEHTNSHNNVNLLLAVGYGLNLNQSRVIFMMEYGLNLTFNYSGRIIDADRRIIYTDQMVDFSKTRTAGIAGFKFLVEHPISDQISLGGGFSLRQQLGSGFKDIDNNITMLSGDISIHYNF